jgi:tetratricopeptide (TPR) repeat protein
VQQYTRKSRIQGWITHLELTLGKLLEAQGRLAEAEQAYRAWQPHAANVSLNSSGGLAYSHLLLGNLMAVTGRFAQAEQEYRAGLRLVGDVDLSHIGNYQWQFHFADLQVQLGDVLSALGKSGEAAQAYRAAIVAREQMALPQPTYLPDLARAHEQLATHFFRTDRLAEARDEYQRAKAILARYVKLRPEGFAGFTGRERLAWFLANCADVAMREPAQAVRSATEAVAIADKQGSVTTRRHFQQLSYRALGAAQYRAGDWKAAAAALQKSMDLRAGGDGFDWFFLAMANARLGKVSEARALYDRAVRWMAKTRPCDPELVALRTEAGQTLAALRP